MRLSLKSADVSGALEKVKRANEAALGVTAENALSDTRPYVPYDTGALQGSGQTKVSGERAYLEYGTDADTSRYARVQYYNAHNHGTAQNAIHAPKACDHWGERSKADNGERWAKMHASEMRRHLS